MNKKLDTANLPPDVITVWGDFNTIGLSDKENDTCIYSIHRDFATKLEVEGFFKMGPSKQLFFVYDEEGDGTVIGQLCVMEGNINGLYRARPVDAKWYSGILPKKNE